MKEQENAKNIDSNQLIQTFYKFSITARKKGETLRLNLFCILDARMQTNK